MHKRYWTSSLEVEKSYCHIYMLFTGWEVRMVKNCERGLENIARGRRTDPSYWPSGRPHRNFYEPFFWGRVYLMKKKMISYIMTEGGPVSKIFGPSHQVKCSSDTWEKKVNRGKLKWLLVWILWELYIVGLYFYLKNCFFQYHDVPRRACVQFHLGNQLGN